MSCVNGLFSYLDPFQKRLHLNQAEIPAGYPSDAVIALDITLADYKNILKPIPDRKVAVLPTDGGFQLRFHIGSISDGCEIQKYAMKEGIPYITSINAAFKKSGTKVYKYFLRYKPFDVSGSAKPNGELKHPSLVFDVTEPPVGMPTFQLYMVTSWNLSPVKDQDFLLEVMPGTLMGTE